MKDGLNSKIILIAYQRVMEQGHVTPNGKMLDGIEAFNQPDGFEVHLQGEGVNLKVCSSNRFHLDYNKRDCRDIFLNKLSMLAK